jgi:hypothetical protein
LTVDSYIEIRGILIDLEKWKERQAGDYLGNRTRLEITSKAIIDSIACLLAVKPVVRQDSKHGED